MTTQEMRERREALVAEMADCVPPEGQEWTPENREKFDKLRADHQALAQQIEDAARAEGLDAVQRATLPESQRPADVASPEAATAQATYTRALGQYLRGASIMDMTAEERQALRQGYRPIDTAGLEQRDLSTLSGAAGGYVVAPDTRFYGAIVQAMKFFGGMEQVGAEVITTDTGADLPIPISDDTSNTGAIVSEEGSHTGGTEPTLGQKVLRAYLYSSKELKVSWQFLQDSAIDVETWLGARIGERLARIQNTHFTTGTGANQPEGVMTASTQGRQAATGNTTTIPFDDVFRLIHAVDPAYRNERCRFMMNDATALALRLAKDGNGRYLWPEMGSVQVGQPMRLAGYSVVVNNDVATMAASAKSISFGDHYHYKIRRVSGLTIIRLGELYAANGQVAFLGFMRCDGGLVDAGQNPIQHFANSAS